MDVYYPITLKIAGKKIVVIGAGKVAERKIDSLLASYAVITVISPDASDKIKLLAEDGRIQWLKKFFSKEDLHGAFMIFATTNDRTLNQLVKAEAQANQIVSIADDPDGSDFHVPAKFNRGRLSIAVSTGGASPSLAHEICGQLEKEFDQQYEDFLEFLYKMRQKVLAKVKDPVLKRKLLKEMASPQYLKSENREKDFIKLLVEVSKEK